MTALSQVTVAPEGAVGIVDGQETSQIALRVLSTGVPPTFWSAYSQTPAPVGHEDVPFPNKKPLPLPTVVP